MEWLPLDGTRQPTRNDVIERLDGLEDRFRFFFDTVAVAIWVHDFRPLRSMLDDLRAAGVRDMRRHVADHPAFVVEARRSVVIIDVNATALKMLGVPDKDSFYKRLSEFPPEEDESFARCIVAIAEGRISFISETSVRAVSGEMIPIVVALNFPPGAGLASIIGCMTDIRDRVRHEDELARARGELDRALRAANMGQLAATNAHEVSQPLSAVMNYAKAAERWLGRPTPDIAEARAMIARIMSATQHSAGVVKNVRKLMGDGGPELSPVVFDPIAAEAVQYARAGLDPGAVIVFSRFDAADIRVLGDRVLLQQVIINLFTNAAHAMEHLPPDRRRLSVRTMLRDGEIVCEIEDEGPGIPDEVKAAAFRAFHTTKAGGMGLGLSICRSTIEAHGGRILLGDAIGGGALVSFSLPLIPAMPLAPSIGPRGRLGCMGDDR